MLLPFIRSHPAWDILHCLLESSRCTCVKRLRIAVASVWYGFDIPSVLACLTCIVSPGKLFGFAVCMSCCVPSAHPTCTSCLLMHLLQMGYLPASAPGLTIETNAPFNLTSFALSLLLVFRTNTSYSRWAEARSIWGGVTNRSRDILRQVSHKSWEKIQGHDKGVAIAIKAQ